MNGDPYMKITVKMGKKRKHLQNIYYGGIINVASLFMEGNRKIKLERYEIDTSTAFFFTFCLIFTTLYNRKST